MVEQRAEHRQGAVAVVDELDDARLLRPVDVRRGVDLPEAARDRRIRRAPVRDDGVAVRVAVHPEHRVREPEQQVANGRAEHAPNASAIAHRLDGVVAEQHEDSVACAAGDHIAALVKKAAAAGRQLGGEPRELRGVDRPLGSAERVHRVEDDAPHRSAVERVVGVAGAQVPPAVAVAVRAAAGPEVLGDRLRARQRPAVRVRRDDAGRSGEQRLQCGRITAEQAERQLDDVGARRQVADLDVAGGNRCDERRRRDVALDEPVVVAECGQPGSAQAGRVERPAHGVEQSGQGREAVARVGQVVGLAGRRAVRVPVTQVVVDEVRDALVLREVT